MIRVLVVEDSLTVRKRLIEVLDAQPDLEVVGEAENGRQAIELCESLRPDVITLDMVLPLMSGLAATEYIMAHCPTPILVVSSSINRRELFETYEALSAGALAVFEKPGPDTPLEEWAEKLVARVRMVSRIAVVTHPRGRLARVASPSSPPPIPGSISGEEGIRVLAIGGSTGGPRAIVDILRRLPASYPIPILLVIHIGPTLGGAMASWLNSHTPMNVSFAVDGEALPEPHCGRVVMAPPDQHMVVEGEYLRLTQAPLRNYCRPSVDVLFESVAGRFGASSAGCLLTGMGRDGAAGLGLIREAGGVTFAQDRESSAVFGMPGEAIARGAVQHVLALEDMAAAFMQLDPPARTGATRRTR